MSAVSGEQREQLIDAVAGIIDGHRALDDGDRCRCGWERTTRWHVAAAVVDALGITDITGRLPTHRGLFTIAALEVPE